MIAVRLQQASCWADGGMPVLDLRAAETIVSLRSDYDSQCGSKGRQVRVFHLSQA